jgi:hypothetical protein
MKDIPSALKKRQRQKTEQFRKHYAPEFSSAAALRRWKDSLRKTGLPAVAAKRSVTKRGATKRAGKKSPVRRASA